MFGNFDKSNFIGFLNSKLSKYFDFFNLILASILLFTIYIIYKSYTSNWGLIITSNIFQIYILPISLMFSALALRHNNLLKKQAIELERVKLTNVFIDKFRLIMHNFSIHSSIIRRFYSNDKKLSELFEKIKSIDKLEFTEEFLESILPSGLSLTDIREYASITEERYGYKHLDEYINICLELYNLDAYELPNAFNSKCKSYLDKIEHLKEEKSSIVSKQGSSTKAFVIDTKPDKKQEKLSKDINATKIYFANSMRLSESSILNDMECLLFNVNFDLLNYNQLLHLIIAPFKSYINSFYVDMVITIAKGDKENRLYFSNIIEFYNKMIDLEIRYKNKINKIKLRNKKTKSKINHNHHIKID